jgi:hypothetical protein
MAASPNNEGSLKKLQIESFTTADFTTSTGKKFAALVNPSSISRRLSVAVNTQNPPPGRTNTEAKYKNVNPETISFDLHLDGTGVIEGTEENANKTVTQLVDKFLEVTLKFNGQTHEPPYTKINWGTLEFKGRITNCDISYTLFKPSGDPLRAKLSVTFTSATTNETQNKQENRSSPDLSHALVVKEGDTLPLMCNKIYKDSSMYVQVARINRLVNFRKLVPGTTILFPPIK